MEQKFFRIAFAASGDRQTIPDNAPSSGAVSFPSGWGADYSKDPTVDANAKPVEREAMNEILHAITNAVRQYQVFGFPEWITTADNGGVAFSYSVGAVVRYRSSTALAFKSYVSIADSNTSVPGADESKWQEFIYREASEEEAIAGEGSTQVMTPRRVKYAASALDEALRTALTPYLTGIGEITLWGGPESTIPHGKLRCNGQSFDTTLNPIFALQYPDGRVPNLTGRYVIGASDGNPVGTMRDADWDHYHPVGQWHTDDGYGGDDAGFISGRSISRSDKNLSKWGGKSYYARATFGDWNRRNEHTVPQQNLSDSVDTGDQIVVNDNGMHPADVSLYYIIKTDQAESEQGSGAPTTIVVTPANSILNAGKTRQMSGLILPTESAAGYVIEWTVSDTELGSINASGMYAAFAGKSGVQTVIASISTGLVATATITQQVYLTSISIGAVPDELLAGHTYIIPVTYSPTGYTEPVNASSSDSNVATITVDGTLTVSGAGAVTLSLIGANSGVTDSITITTKAVVVPETRLLIQKNLAEIKENKATAQAEARTNLGLKALATKEALTASDVGTVSQSDTSLGTENLNAVVALGRKFQSLTSNATLTRNYPVALAGMLDVIKTTGTGIRQTFYPYNNTDVYHRYCVDVSADPVVFGAWGKSGDNYLDKSQNLADVPNKALARDNIGVGYTISTSEPPASASGYAQGHIWYQL